MMIVTSYYLVGLPLGGYLMLNTELKNFGFWIGIFTAIILLVTQQTIYILRVDWKKTAELVSGLNYFRRMYFFGENINTFL